MFYKTIIIRKVRYLDEPNRTINITAQKDQKQTQITYLVYDNDCVSINEKYLMLEHLVKYLGNKNKRIVLWII